MRTRSLKLKYAITLAVCSLFLEALSGEVFSFHSIPAWIVMSMVNFTGSFCLLAVFSRKGSTSRTLRPHWWLLASGMVVRIFALALWTWILFAHHGDGHLNPKIANLSNLLFLYCIVPTFVVLSLPGGKAYPALYFSVDALQYAVAGYLSYLIFYTITPFTNIPAVLLHSYYDFFSLYNVEATVLTIAAMLRFLASIDDRQGSFYRTLFQVFVVELILSFIGSFFFMHHYIVVARVINSSLLWIDCLLFFYARDEGEVSILAIKTDNARAIFFDLASPLFITLVALTLAVYVARNLFWAGMIAIVANCFLFGLRATLLQVRYIQSRISLQEARDRLEELSLRDALTGVANRRCFDQTLESEWNRAVRVKHPLSLLMIDVDLFKELNDRYGHRMGDDCLVRIAIALRDALPRSGDVLSRYGGEEFAVILPGTDEEGAHVVAANMQEAIKALDIRNETALGEHATVSMGIATYIFPNDGSPELLVEASDRALYQAKDKGRNRIEFTIMSSVSGLLSESV